MTITLFKDFQRWRNGQKTIFLLTYCHGKINKEFSSIGLMLQIYIVWNIQSHNFECENKINSNVLKVEIRMNMIITIVQMKMVILFIRIISF